MVRHSSIEEGGFKQVSVAGGGVGMASEWQEQRR